MSETKFPKACDLFNSFLFARDVEFYIRNTYGNRRTMNVDMPVIGSSEGGAGETRKINTVIPDAFNVSITLQGLNDETRNFLYESISPGTVTSRMSDESFAQAAADELI